MYIDWAVNSFSFTVRINKTVQLRLYGSHIAWCVVPGSTFRIMPITIGRL